MIKGRNQHVVPRDDGWAVKPEGGQRASSIHGTQREAIDRSRNQNGTVTVTPPNRQRAEPGRAGTVQARRRWATTLILGTIYFRSGLGSCSF
jgi:Uncharacterized protein conserved in bacteria (DUF2188)